MKDLQFISHDKIIKIINTDENMHIQIFPFVHNIALKIKLKKKLLN